jgi:cytochrome bd-type quinol oxidase subunit 2
MWGSSEFSIACLSVALSIGVILTTLVYACDSRGDKSAPPGRVFIEVLAKGFLLLFDLAMAGALIFVMTEGTQPLSKERWDLAWQYAIFTLPGFIVAFWWFMYLHRGLVEILNPPRNVDEQ